MKKLLALAFFAVALVFFTGCNRTSGSNDRYSAVHAFPSEAEGLVGSLDDEYIPLNEDDLRTLYKVSDSAYSQSKLTPGKGSLPYLDQFQKPSGELSTLFSMLHFEVDDHILRNREDLVTVSKIATYLKRHPNLYVVVEGHCDETASAAYNMALGARRANHVRVLLIKQGIDFNRIYPVSYGKERPVALTHDASAWKENRRAEFKLHFKK